jgi:dethiobiotin synthetase
VVAVVGTGTDIGKTWVAARLLGDLRAAGLHVAARKPAQSFDPADDPADLDAAVLAAATHETAEDVCPPHRWYETAMAPPMAAAALQRPPFTIDELIAEVRWPPDMADVGLVETAGGLRSPLAADGDCLDFCAALVPDVVVLVADAGLGTINAVRLNVDVLAPLGVPTVVVLNRFDDASDLHRRNLEWLRRQDALGVGDVLGVLTIPEGGVALADIVRG